MLKLDKTTIAAAVQDLLAEMTHSPDPQVRARRLLKVYERVGEAWSNLEPGEGQELLTFERYEEVMAELATIMKDACHESDQTDPRIN